jgi:hypothetical protein
MTEEPFLPPDVFEADRACFIIGGGPSIKNMDLRPLIGRPMITVNRQYVLFPESTVHFSCDGTWLKREAPDFDKIHTGRFRAYCRHEFKGDRRQGPYGMKVYHHERAVEGSARRTYNDRGLTTALNHLRGNNSGGMAINLAWHLGARLLVLLGFDMQMRGPDRHWYPETPDRAVCNPTTYRDVFLPVMNSIAEPAKALGMRIVNATPGSALTCFETANFEEFL